MKPSTQAEQLFALESRAVPTVARFVCPPDLRSTTWIKADGDWASYRMRRANALWFASASDDTHYAVRGNRVKIDIQKGHSVKCSNQYYLESVAAWSRLALSVRVAAVGLTHTTAAIPTAAANVDLNRARECFCLKCLEVELTARFALRGETSFHAAEQTEEIQNV